MRYMGSKKRIAKKLLPYMLPHRKDGQCWVEPFVGSGGMIEHVTGWRIGSDLDPYIIALHRAIQNGWVPPSGVTREFYQEVKNNNESYPPELVAFLGYGVSFGGKWFSSWIDQTKKHGPAQSMRSCLRQRPRIQDVLFLNTSYDDLEIPKNSLIYCDPPYASTTKYKFDFDHESFWQWCRDMSAAGHTVFVSEYSAPDDVELVFELEHKTTFYRNKQSKRIERLYRV